jgi:hypothetical protein
MTMPVKLVTHATGLDENTNRTVYGYLESLRDRGEICQADLEFIVSSFSEIELRVVSSSRFRGRLKKFILDPDWCTEQSSIEMLTSMAALDVMIDMEKIRDKDREDTIRRIHARLVDIFFG